MKFYIRERVKIQISELLFKALKENEPIHTYNRIVRIQLLQAKMMKAIVYFSHNLYKMVGPIVIKVILPRFHQLTDAFQN